MYGGAYPGLQVPWAMSDTRNTDDQPPVYPCVLLNKWCNKQIDCSACDEFKLKVEWCCSFCVVGRRETMAGGHRDRVVPGVYSSGICRRCGNDRVALLAVTPWEELAGTLDDNV